MARHIAARVTVKSVSERTQPREAVVAAPSKVGHITARVTVSRDGGEGRKDRPRKGVVAALSMAGHAAARITVGQLLAACEAVVAALSKVGHITVRVAVSNVAG